MGLVSRLLGRGSSTDEDDEETVEERTKTFGLWEATLSYQSGGTETVEFVGRTKDESGYTFYQNVPEDRPPLGEEPTPFGGESEFVPFAVLDEPPEIVRVGTVEARYLFDSNGPAPGMGDATEITSVERRRDMEGDL